jgi:hypothetical protein
VLDDIDDVPFYLAFDACHDVRRPNLETATLD